MFLRYVYYVVLYYTVIIIPCPHRARAALMAVVCPSVCTVPDRNSRMEGRSKLTIGIEAHDMGDS